MPFPAETQSVRIGRDIPTPFSSGWIYLNLNQPPDFIAQSFVSVRQDFRKRRSRAPAMYFTNACDSTTDSLFSRAGRGGRR